MDQLRLAERTISLQDIPSFKSAIRRNSDERGGPQGRFDDTDYFRGPCPFLTLPPRCDAQLS